MATTISIDQDLWIEFKSTCIKRKIYPSKLIEDYILWQLLEWDSNGNTIEGKLKKCIICEKEFIPKGHAGPLLFCSNTCSGLYQSRNRYPNLKEDYFEIIDTKEKAYWLGFILADGCITERKNCNSLQFSFGLMKTDEEYVDALIKAIGLNNDNVPKQYYTKTVKGSVYFSISNSIFCNNLIQQGCNPKKSKTLIFPNFNNEELDLALLLGYFDGDGTLGGGPSICGASKGVFDYIKNKYNLPYIIGIHSKCANGTDSVYSLRLGWELYEKMINNYEYSMKRKRTEIPKSYRFRLTDIEKSIKRIDNNGNEKIYKNARDAIKEISNVAKTSKIYDCCRGKAKIAYGYKWQYID